MGRYLTCGGLGVTHALYSAGTNFGPRGHGRETHTRTIKHKHVIIHILKLSITKCKGRHIYVHVIIRVLELSKGPSDE